MFLTALLAAACLTSLPATQGRTPAPISGANTSEATAEGIEILRRIVIDSLDKAFETKKEGKTDALTLRQGFQSDGLVTRLWAGGGTVQHARAFHMPDAGLFFALDASLPVVSKDKEKEAGKPNEPPSNDEWERARREVRGIASTDGTTVLRGRFFVQPKEAGEIDPKAIDQMIDVLLRTLARHVGRIEGLGQNESVTIAVRLSGKNESWLHDFSTDEPSEQGDEGDEKLEHEMKAYSTFVLATGQDVREQNLVIRVALSDLLAAGENGGDRLRARAQINRY